MTSQPTRPKLAVIAGDTISDGSRAQKVALSAALAGWNVALFGQSRSGAIEHTWYGPVKVTRVPVKPMMTAVETNRRRRSPRARVTQAGLPTPEAADAARAVHRARVRARSERTSRLDPAPRVAFKAWSRVLERGFAARIRAYEWEERHRTAPDLPVGKWRRDCPELLDLDLTLGPVIERFRPDVIHAHDVTTMAVAATTSGRLRAAGHKVSWVYDAPAYVAGVEWPTPRMASAMPQVESEHIHRADAVVTVSPEIAEQIKTDRQLSQTPLVVRDMPAPDKEELCWEHQVVGLLSLYASLAGHAPEPRRRSEHGWDLRERARRLPERGKRSRGSAPPRRWRELSETPVRLGLGPANFAGQLAAIARAVTDVRPDVSAEVFMNVADVGFGYPADVYLRTKTLRRLDIQLDQVRRIVPRYTHLIADAFYPVFGKLNGHDISGDLPTLRQARINVGLLAHGSDIRHPLRHIERVPYSLFRDAPDEDFIRSRAWVAERNRRIADEAGLPAFVTTPDLLVDLPQATWLPLVVDVSTWVSDRPVMERARPKVLHAPSARWTKGTDRFIAQLEALDARGAIELQLVEGVKWRAMRELVQEADLVVDQFAVGAYGTFACEAMAAGKPVLAFLTEQVIDAIGETPPIINVSPDAVGAAVEQLLENREEAIRLGRDSSAYVRRYHDGGQTASRLSDFLEQKRNKW